MTDIEPVLVLKVSDADWRRALVLFKCLLREGGGNGRGYYSELMPGIKIEVL